MSSVKYHFIATTFLYVIAGIIPSFFFPLSVFGEKAIIALYAMPLLVVVSAPYSLIIKSNPGLTQRTPQIIYVLFTVVQLVKILLLTALYFILSRIYESENSAIYCMLFYSMLSINDVDGVADYYLLKASPWFPITQKIIRISIYIVMYCILYTQFLDKTLHTAVFIEFISLLISSIFTFALLTQKFGTTTSTFSILKTIILIRRYYGKSLKKRLLTVLTARMDIIIATQLLTTPELGMLARVKTFTSITPQILKHILLNREKQFFLYSGSFSKKQKKEYLINFKKYKRESGLDVIFALLFSLSLLITFTWDTLVMLLPFTSNLSGFGYLIGAYLIRYCTLGATRLENNISIYFRNPNFIVLRSFLDLLLMILVGIFCLFFQQVMLMVFGLIASGVLFYIFTKPNFPKLKFSDFDRVDLIVCFAILIFLIFGLRQ